MPLTNTAALYLLNFFIKAKGLKRTIDVYKRQALYNGAVSARGIYELRSYVDQEALINNNAYIITLTYHYSRLFTIYITYPTLSEGPINPIEYRIT